MSFVLSPSFWPEQSSTTMSVAARSTKAKPTCADEFLRSLSAFTSSSVLVANSSSSESHSCSAFSPGSLERSPGSSPSLGQAISVSACSRQPPVLRRGIATLRTMLFCRKSALAAQSFTTDILGSRHSAFA
ncbi:hypothetical protein NP493_668g00031 [Ridgeia piscesae]|uniref:Uncharacterized protein n=1 Tax=Ridgeia piscesae TaxID=27915 RepID=A0AAD9NPY0_RIDPI|nr:hypothetical protein NP493_668g00031 [Ridgeia piscesae]